MQRIAIYNFKALVEGSLSLFFKEGSFFLKGTGGTDSARYCYSVWLRHLIRTAVHRRIPLDATVVELGPGDSLGIGLAAILCGVSSYTAIDSIKYASLARNLKVFEELVSLFGRRTAIPAADEFPEIKPELEDYGFPNVLLDANKMSQNLASQRVESIRTALQKEWNWWATIGSGEPLVRYVDPAVAETAIPPASVGWVFSQAVLEHVSDLQSVYRSCYDWLKPNGLMSHQIDFRSHGLSRVWNGHWAYPDTLWKLLQGKRPLFLNREPCSTHLRLMRENGFKLLVEERSMLKSQLESKELAPRFRRMTEQDLTTSGLFVVAQKPE